MTRIPRREHSALTVERNDRKPSVGDGYVKLSLQYLETPASVLVVSPATTTGTPLLPRERVAARALRVLPSRIRTLSFRESDSGFSEAIVLEQTDAWPSAFATKVGPATACVIEFS